MPVHVHTAHESSHRHTGNHATYTYNAMEQCAIVNEGKRKAQSRMSRI